MGAIDITCAAAWIARITFVAVFSVGVSGLAWAAPNVSAETANHDEIRDGLDLANRIHYRPRAKGQASQTVMTLRGGGVERVRELYQYRLDGNRRGDTSTLIRFISPRDISGTGLLTVDSAESDDSDQWVYLPALGRERRISADRKGGKFLGSDLFFEDLRDRDPGKDHHVILKSADLNGKKHWVLESTPKSPQSSVYSRRVGWIDRATYTPMRLDYYVQGKAEPVKRWLVNKIEKIDGYWLVIDRTMTDLGSGTSTHLQDVKVRNHTEIDPTLFTRRSLIDDSHKAEKPWRP